MPIGEMHSAWLDGYHRKLRENLIAKHQRGVTLELLIRLHVPVNQDVVMVDVGYVSFWVPVRVKAFVVLG